MNTFLFCILQLFNVVLSTIKSIVTIQSSPGIAGIVNALYFTIYYGIIKMINSQDMAIVLVVAFITNLTGVPLAKIIMKKFKKDNLWIFHSIIYCTEQEAIDIKASLKKKNITAYYDSVNENKLYNVRIFSYSKEDSSKIIDILNEFNAEYYIVKEDK